jgi:hypothetical protein
MGVLIYNALSGYYPFYPDETDDVDESTLKKDIYNRITKGKFNFEKIEFRNVSPLAKDFIRNLLQVDIKRR